MQRANSIQSEKNKILYNFCWTILDMLKFSNIRAINIIMAGRAIVTSTADKSCCSSSST